MRIVTWFITSVLVLTACTTQTENTATRLVTYNEILSYISEPIIPTDTFNVTDYGAIGDSVTACKAAVDKAIIELKQSGGGVLFFPSGQYYMDGPIHFTSNMDMHLEEGARLFFSSDPKKFLPVVKTSWEGTILLNYSPFVYAYNSENLKISGKGTIDGEASETWAKWKEIQKKDQMLSREMNHNEMPIEERLFGDGHFLRPQLIQFFNCKNVMVQDVKIEDSPFWCLHVLRCQNVIVRGISYDAQNKNNDGIDPEYSRNVLIENITFNNSDDNVAIKAGRDNEGRASAYKSENIIIRNCTFKGLHAIVVGSEMSAGVQNVYVKNCSYAGKLKRGVYLKSNPDRGGFIRNIFVDSVSFGEVEDCIYVTSYYHNEGEGHVTDIRDIHLSNITCKRATSSGIVLQGFPDNKISNIYFSNITIDSAGNPLSMENTDKILFSDVVIGELATAPSFAK